jgi:hypothetical protein
MRLRAAGRVPPNVLLEPDMITPWLMLPRSRVPVGSVPMKLPSIVLPVGVTLAVVKSPIPVPKRLITSPFTKQFTALMYSPVDDDGGTLAPVSCMSSTALASLLLDLAPGWL